MASSGTNRGLGIGLLVVGVAVGALSIIATATKLGATTSTESKQNPASAKSEAASQGTAPPADRAAGATTPTKTNDTGAAGATTAPPSTSTSTAADPTSSTVAPATEPPQQFLTALAAAIASGDSTFRYDRLNPAVIKRFGEPACRAYVASGAPDRTAAFTVLKVSEPANYDWTTDGLTTTVPNTLTVTVRRTSNGQQSQADVHITEVDGKFTYYADCGTPQL